MKKEYMIYKYTSPSGGVYIGQTNKKNVHERALVNGKGYLNFDKETGKYLQAGIANAILKYGFDNFQKEILFEGLTSDEADKKEIELIAYYKQHGECYNIASGGKGVPGTKFTKIKQYNFNGELVGTWDSVEEAALWLGNKKYQANISACCKGRKHRAYGYIWRYFDDNSEVIPIEPYREKVCQFTKYGEYIATYNTIAEAGRMTGIGESAISNALKNRVKTSGGYVWKFERNCK